MYVTLIFSYLCQSYVKYSQASRSTGNFYNLAWLKLYVISRKRVHFYRKMFHERFWKTIIWHWNKSNYLKRDQNVGSWGSNPTWLAEPSSCPTYARVPVGSTCLDAPIKQSAYQQAFVSEHLFAALTTQALKYGRIQNTQASCIWTYCMWRDQAPERV